MRTRHKYFYRNENGLNHRRNPDRRDFIHYTRTGRVWGKGGKVREIKRGTVAIPKSDKKR